MLRWLKSCHINVNIYVSRWILSLELKYMWLRMYSEGTNSSRCVRGNCADLDHKWNEMFRLSMCTAICDFSHRKCNASRVVHLCVLYTTVAFSGLQFSCHPCWLLAWKEISRHDRGGGWNKCTVLADTMLGKSPPLILFYRLSVWWLALQTTYSSGRRFVLQVLSGTPFGEGRDKSIIEYLDETIWKYQRRTVYQ